MIELDEHLQRLADSVELPRTDPEDDLARGRARRRHRHLGVIGAAATTAAVIGTSVVVLSGGPGHQGTNPGFAGGSSKLGDTSAAVESPAATQQAKQEDARERAKAITLRQLLRELSRSDQLRLFDRVLSGYRDILREDLDPAGARIQTGKITNEQVGDDSLGTKLDWNRGGMLQIAVGRSLEGVQFFCDGGCTEQSVAGATKALVLTGDGTISVAVFQDDGDIVALTADTSFGNNGTSSGSLGVTVDQLLAAAADPRLDLPDGSSQSSGAVGTQ